MKILFSALMHLLFLTFVDVLRNVRASSASGDKEGTQNRNPELWGVVGPTTTEHFV